MRNSTPLIMSFLVGFLSLSQEILWVRILGFLTQGAPNVMSIVLSGFLLGIAIGAIVGKRICNSKIFSFSFIVWIWVAIGVVDLLLSLILPVLMNSDFQIPLFMVVIMATAALKATIFPIAHHMFTSVNESKLGRSLSYVYLCNILGSTLGPLLTGFVFLDLLSLFDAFRLLGLVAVLFAVIMSLFSHHKKLKIILPTSVAMMGIFMVVASPELPSFPGYLKSVYEQPVVYVSENRQGIIHVVKDGVRGDIIYGGNAYDGRANISLTNNSNKIDRVFLLSALHPNPKKVLVIGLSGGAWTRVLAGNADVEKIDVVEINPGYLDYIKSNKVIEPILNDPKVTIYIDDGRKWLRDPSKRAYYDLIVSNTTFYWRSYSTNLLSKEMIKLVKSSLAPGGIYAFNATGSKDAHYTAASVFSEAYRWSNFIYSSDHSFIKSPAEISESVIKKYKDWPYDDLEANKIESIFNGNRFFSLSEELAGINRELEVITDDNMIVEYKYGIN